MKTTLRALTDDDLRLRLEDLVRQERENTVEVIEHLMEVDRRGLAMEWGYPSLWVYCTTKLNYSEGATSLRIRAAHAATKFPEVLEKLRAGKITLDSLARLSPVLTVENNTILLEQAAGAPRREVEKLVASIRPTPPAERDVIVPMAPPAPHKAEDTLLAVPEVLETPKHRFHFSADSELLTVIEQLRGHLRHKFPEGRLEDIFLLACKETLERLEKKMRPTQRKQRPARKSRRVPAAVKREVWTRDGGVCTYTSPEGVRCASANALEFDHIRPWALGGPSTAENIRLLCRAHNQWLGRKHFGDRRTKSGN